MNYLISIWGKNGSGKSTVASNLACAFAKRGVKTALVGANRFYGSIQYCFNMEIQAENSLRTMLTGGDSLSVKELFKECPSVRNLFIASLADADDCAGYRKMRTDTVIRFIGLVQKSFPVVLIDCDESIEDPLSMYSLTRSDKIVYLTRPSLQSLVFAKAYEHIISGLQIKEQLIVVMVNDSATLGASGKAAGDAGMYAPFRGDGQYRILPFCGEIVRARGGPAPIMLSHSLSRASGAYRKEINQLAAALCP